MNGCPSLRAKSTVPSPAASTRPAETSGRSSSSARDRSASLLQFPVIRADGTIPFAGTNYSGRSATWVDTTRKSPYAMNWNFGVQHSFASNYLVELTYTGNSSVNGFENREINSVSYDWANNLRLTNPDPVQRLP